MAGRSQIESRSWVDEGREEGGKKNLKSREGLATSRVLEVKRKRAGLGWLGGNLSALSRQALLDC